MNGKSITIPSEKNRARNMEQFFGSAAALAEFERMQNIQEKIKLMWGLPVSQVHKPLMSLPSKPP